MDITTVIVSPGISRMATDVDSDVTTDGVHFRKATAADYDDVVSLRPQLHHGTDYLPSQYHHLLHTHTGFCGFIGNQMVGFILAIIIDDGETIVMRAGRVRKEHENKGIGMSLRKYCLRNLPRTVKRESLSLFSSDLKDSAISKGAKLTWQRENVLLRAEKTTIEKIIKSVTVSDSLRIVDEFALAKLFSSPELTSRLFPGDYLVVNSVPYQARSSNMSYILTTDRTMYASYDNKVQLSNSSQPVLVSVAYQIRCEAGTRFNIDFYGDVSIENQVSDHIISQMAKCLSESDGNILMVVTFPVDIREDILLNIIDRLSLKITLREPQYCVVRMVRSDATTESGLPSN